MSSWAAPFVARDRLGVAAWAERHRRWDDGSPFRLSETPYVTEILRAVDDPGVEEITVVKPARTGVTEGVALNVIGHAIDHDPKDVMLIVPGGDMTTTFSARKLRPFLEANPRLAHKLNDGGRADALTEKSWSGGTLRIAGAGSARSFRMIEAGTAIGDDVDGWDSFAGRGAGNEGDQVTLIRRRTDTIPDRKLLWLSTPTREGSRIESLYQESESRGVFQVPCPACGEYRTPTWDLLRWDKTGRHIWYECPACGEEVPESEKPDMAARGLYLDENGEPALRDGVRTLGLWLRGSLFVTLPGKEWGRMVNEWRAIGRSAVKRRAFVNTVLAESWEDRGEAPSVENLSLRREDLPRAVVPAGALMLTAGADLQQNRVEVYVYGWGANGERWPVDVHVVTRDQPDYWGQVSALLDGTYPTADGGDMGITRMAFDAGNETELVKGWQRRTPDRRVMLIKGSSNRHAPLLGHRPKGGFPIVWEAGVSQAKHLLYHALRLPMPAPDEAFPPGFVHLPMWWTEEMIGQLTAEVFDTTPDPRGFPKNRWVNPHGRRNEALDCAVYARIAAEPEMARGLVGANPEDRPKKKPRSRSEDDAPSKRDGSWLGRDGRGRGRGRRGGGKWLDR